MLLNELRPPKGAVKNRKRLGRGESSGQGKTSGRGHKGQKARAGGFHKKGFEGGQMPLQRRIPKRGFYSFNGREYAVVNVGDLARFQANSEVTAAVLKEAGLVRKILDGVKVLGDGAIDRPLTVKAARFSETAKQKIEKAGGKAILEGAQEGI
ncbi:MAG: 50S ribosomal protein L15 [Deltaproteobacteria bacterium]|nr:50S ribosomal protein L15 [Deltaproteobacteria bacterium]